jgi:hypothetical protein
MLFVQRNSFKCQAQNFYATKCYALIMKGIMIVLKNVANWVIFSQSCVKYSSCCYGTMCGYNKSLGRLN